MNKYYNKSNFTVIELLAAITIIVILVGISVGVYSYVFTKIKNDRTQALIKKLEMAMRSYKHDTGYYFQQSTLGNLTIDTSDTDFLKHIGYSNMKSRGEINSTGQVTDAWGDEIEYQAPGTHNTTMFDLGSKGKNRVYGSTGNVSDFGTVDDITNFSKD